MDRHDGSTHGGKVAIVTGGGRGLGRAMALGMAEAGMSVVVTAARGRAELDAVAAEPRAEGRIVALDADVTRPETGPAVVARTLDLFGRLDVLVNNAGRGMRFVSEDFLSVPTRFWDTDSEVWRMVVDTNVNGPFYMARAAAPALMRAEHGRIVNMSMNRETMRRAGFSPYGPSKAALESETAIWARDLAHTTVTVNALLPGGATLTGMIPEFVSADIRAGLLDPAIVVPPLLWLVSDASDGITGRRIDAARWHADDPRAAAAVEEAGWA